MSQQIEKILDSLGVLTDKLASGTGLLIFALLISIVFVLFSYVNPVNLHAPGVYFFGVILPAGLFIKAGASVSAPKVKFTAYFLSALIVAFGILDTVRRVYW